MPRARAGAAARLAAVPSPRCTLHSSWFLTCHNMYMCHALSPLGSHASLPPRAATVSTWQRRKRSKTARSMSTSWSYARSIGLRTVRRRSVANARSSGEEPVRSLRSGDVLLSVPRDVPTSQCDPAIAARSGTVRRKPEQRLRAGSRAGPSVMDSFAHTSLRWRYLVWRAVAKPRRGALHTGRGNISKATRDTHTRHGSCVCVMAPPHWAPRTARPGTWTPRVQGKKRKNGSALALRSCERAV
jgi:hypothetical protein